MIISRSSNSFLISAGIHMALLFFLANFASQVPQIGVQPFKPSEVNILDDAEKKRVRDWLEKQRREQEIKPDTAPKDVSAQINRKLQEMFKPKDQDLSKIRQFQELPPDSLNLREQLGLIAPLVADIKPEIKDTIVDTARIGEGTLLAKVDTSGGDGRPGLDGKPARIKIEFDINDTAKPMALRDDPMYIAKAPDFGQGLPGGNGVAGDIAGSTGTGVQSGADDESQVLQRGDGMEARIIGELRSRKIVSYVLPDIPRSADVLVSKLKVSVKVTVMGNGEVKNNVIIEQTSGYDYIDRAVRDAALRWKFEPLPMSMSWQEQIGVIEIDITFI